MRYQLPYRLMLGAARPRPDFGSAGGVFAEDESARKEALRLFRKNRVIGGALGLFDRNGPTGFLTAGSAGHGHPVLPCTYFRVASVSKMVTGALAAGLAMDGALDLDRDVSGILGVDLRAPAWPGERITPGMLLSHTASVKDTDLLFHPELGLREAAERIAFTGERPGTAFRYSNEGAALLGAVLEKAADMDLDDLLAREFGLQGTYFSARLPRDAHLSDGIRLLPFRKTLLSGAPEDRGEAAPRGPREHWNRAHGGLCLRIGDLLQIGLRLMTDARFDGMRREVIPMGARDPMITEGMGMFVIRYPECGGRTVYGHQGLAYGASHGLFFCPETGRGAAVLTAGCSLARRYVLTDLNRDVIARYLA